MSGTATRTRVGLAYGSAAARVIDLDPELIDYVEVPYEHLHHDPEAFDEIGDVDVLLHSASMSVAGFVQPDDDTLDDIGAWADRTATPWIGEHLAYILADDPRALAASEPIRLTYTLAPQLSERVVAQVGRNLDRLRPRFDQPLILENSPHYVDVPGSDMSYVEFLCEVVDRFDVGLLLDLTHLAISACNVGFDVADGLRRLPLDRVVEVHLSGVSFHDGIAIDDHARLAPKSVLEQLAIVLAAGSARAVTLEYNWAPDHAIDEIVGQIADVRELILSAVDRAR